MAKNQVRIIAGRWRGRKLHFAESKGLRPTPDRVRETLFNWLAPVIEGARCLDLFAGSGVLSFEALSRGAKLAVMTEQSALAADKIQENIHLLSADHASCYPIHFKKLGEFIPDQRFDIVFLDPPFYQNRIAEGVKWLTTQHCLANPAYIYIETEKSLYPLVLPKGWEILRSKTAGEVNYYLIKASLE